MSLGSLNVIIASPQPGTTNTPIPAPPVPAFIPVVVNITESPDLAIAEHGPKVALAYTKGYATVVVPLAQVFGVLAQINGNLADLLTEEKLKTKKLQDLSVAISGMGSAKSRDGLLQASLSASVIQNNNFQTAIAKQKEGPVEVPSAKDQLKEGVVLANTLTSAASGTATLVTFIGDGISDAVTWVASSKVFKEVKGFVSKQIDTVLGFVGVVDPKAEVSKVAGTVGSPGVP